MRTKTKKFLFGLLSFALVLTWFQGKPVLANSEEDFIWEETEYGTARIIDYVGNKKDVVIPRELGGLPVTEIGYKDAFITNIRPFSNKGLTSVIIPDTVQYIGAHAFSFNNITRVVIPDSVIQIGTAAFLGNGLEEVILSNNLKMLAFASFANNKIRELVIPDGVEILAMAEFAFNELERVVMSKNIQIIGDLTFVGNNLKEVFIPKSVVSLSPFAYGINPLEKIVVESPFVNLYFEGFEGGFEFGGEVYDELGAFYDFVSDIDISTFDNFMNAWENDQIKLRSFDHLVIYGHENARIYAQKIGYTFYDFSEYQPEPEPEQPSEESATKQQDVNIEILGDGLSLETSPIQSFGNIALKGEPKTYKTSFESPIKIKDLRGTHEGWTLSVQASQFTNEKGYKLPKGSMTLDGVKTVNGESEINVHLNQTTVIDDGSVIVAHANEGQGMGAVELIFNDDAIGLTIDPATAKLGTYTSTITWTLQATPIAD